jgi:RHS repeat-associated protein
MLMPERSGYKTAGGWASGNEQINGNSVAQTLTVDERHMNTPSEYKASQWIEITDGFTSGSSDEFVAYIADGSNTTAGNPGGSGGENNGYRYGFNGKENDDEVKGVGDELDYGARIYDTRLGRWLSLDPCMTKYAYESNYILVSNNPVFYVDAQGKFKISPQMAKAYPELASFVKKELYNYVLNNVELKNKIMTVTGATQAQFDRVFKPVNNSVPITTGNLPTGAIAETPIDKVRVTINGVMQTEVHLDESFLKYATNLLKNGTDEDKAAAKLAIAILLVHEGTHATLAETGETNDINRFDQEQHDIGKQVEKDVYKNLLIPDDLDYKLSDGYTKEYTKNELNAAIIEQAKKISQDQNTDPNLKPKVNTATQKSTSTSNTTTSNSSNSGAGKKKKS